MNWDAIFTIAPRNESIDLLDPETYVVSNLGNEDISLLQSTIPQIETNRAKEYYIPVNDTNNPYMLEIGTFKIYFWNNKSLQFLLVFQNIEDLDSVHWIISSVAVLYGEKAIDKDTLLNYRYSHLSHITEYIDEPTDVSEFITTIPRVDYTNKIATKTYLGKEPILNIIITEDIRNVHDLIYEIGKFVSYLGRTENPNNKRIIYKIIQLSNQYHEKVIEDKREVVIHQLQLFYVITKIFVPRDIHDEIIEFGDTIRIKAMNLGMDNVVWIIDLLLKWYFGKGEKVGSKGWEDTTIPANLLLIPFMMDINDNTAQLSNEEILLNYLKLNEVIELPILFDAYEVLQERIGKYCLAVNDYTKAELYFNYAMQIYEYQKNEDKVKELKKFILNSIRKHYEELAISANFFSNTSRNQEAQELAWSGLLNALRLVKTVFAFDADPSKSLTLILEMFELCRRPLLKEDSDIREVIALKLDELKQFFASLLTGVIEEDEAKLFLEMHSDSLKFMVPNKAAQFMFMTSDGRLLYVREASHDNFQDTDTSFLLAGALTAIRSVLTEASMSQEGSVKEITLGDSVLLIESRKSVVVVASALKIDDIIRKFTTEIADVIQDRWHDELWDWFGDTESIQDMINFIDTKIEDELID